MARALLAMVLLLVMATPAHAEDRTDQLGTLINRARVDRGVLPLARNAALDQAATAHSKDMVEHNYLDHTGADGSEPQQRADRAGYHVPPHSAWIVVEVISAISDEPAGPLDWWLNQSPEVHGKVLTDPRWREMGVGYADGGEYGHYWTVLVGCRPGVLPTVVLDGKTYEHSERCGDPESVSPSLTVQALPGGDFEVRWSGIAQPTERDWIGLYRPGDADGSYMSWEYVSCGTAPLMARGTGWCWLSVPAGLQQSGLEVRLHSNDSMQVLASSGPVAALY